MAEHLSDEEQLEALKRWWKESGRQTVAVIAIAVLGYFGWNGWQDHQLQQSEKASALYDQMMDAAQVSPGSSLTDEQNAQVTYLAVSLQDEYGSTRYADFASLMLAKLAVQKNDLDTAAGELQTVMDNADEELSLIARLRLARVEAARENYQRAAELIDSVEAGAMAAAYAETRGDIYYQQGLTAQAYEAYQMALSGMPEDDRARSILELKINQVQPRQEKQSSVEGAEQTETSEGNA